MKKDSGFTFMEMGVSIRGLTQKRHPQGFTLIEMCLSVFILLIVLLSMSAQIGLTLNATNSNKSQTIATQTLLDKVEQLKHTSWASIIDGNDSVIKNGVTYNRTWTQTTNGNTKTIALTITWLNKSLNSNLVVSQ